MTKKQLTTTQLEPEIRPSRHQQKSLRSSSVDEGRVDRQASDSVKQSSSEKQPGNEQEQPKEVGGPKGLEPTRYGDWESKGRCYDF